MIISSSTAANVPLPGWAYVPGETTEAGADHETLWQAKALVPSRFRDFVPARHPALRYGIALNDAGSFWESQEVLQVVWAAAPQGGRERILLRACIQIANANLKLRMQKSHAAARLLGEALVEVKALGARKATAAGDEGRLGGDRVHRPNMNKNAEFVIRSLWTSIRTCIIVHDR